MSHNGHGKPCPYDALLLRHPIEEGLPSFHRGTPRETDFSGFARGNILKPMRVVACVNAGLNNSRRCQTVAFFTMFRPLRFVVFASPVLLLVASGCHQASPPPAPNPPASISSRPFPPRAGSRSADPNLVLGNPSGANADANNFLISKPQYTLSFNRRSGTPNWVSWRTTRSDLGDVKRKNDFHPDEMLPADSQITPSDYRGSGYDRGHICPSGDRTNSPEDNSATFSMANMVPQSAELNQHVWADFENYVRDVVKSGNEVYQVSGPAGNAGSIAGGRVVVPQGCWKVVVVLPENSGDVRRINAQTRVIAIAIPNAKDKRLQTADWRSFRTTPLKIERAIHLDLFSNLSPQLKGALEQKTDSAE